MVDLTVDRLHLRYLGEAAGFAEQIGRAAETELEQALRRVALPADGHVCMRRLTVPVVLARGTTTAAASWADQIAQALSLAAAGAAGADLVVYRHTRDVLIDLLTGVGRNDLRREWAWHATGVLPPGPARPASVAAALIRQPLLVCAAITAAASAGPVPLTAGGWAEVADAVRRETGPATVVAAPAVPRPAAFEHPVVHRLPAATIAALPRTARAAIAQLLLLCVRPALSRSGPAITYVVDHLLSGEPRFFPRRLPPGPPATRSALPPAPPRSPAIPSSPGIATAGWSPGAPPAGATTGPVDATATAPADRTHAPAPPGSGPADSNTGPDPSPGAEPPAESLATPMGGVFFLARVLELIEPFPWVTGALSEHPPGTVVGWLAAHLTGVGPDDPAVRLLIEETGEPGPAEEAALDGLAERVTGDLRRMLRTEPDDDLGWFWRRTASIDARPGWIEITFSLDDVDTRIRAAGLDLDPGFVWWLGAVVRFRYA